jgi:hypothetical protein
LIHFKAGGNFPLADTIHTPALTQLSEEESLFYSTVRQFAEEAIAPHVRVMDDEQHIAPGVD